MSKVKVLEVKKIIKELEFIESDFEYKNEIISEADAQFISSINLFLQKHPELKEIYDSKITEKINQSIKKNQEKSDEKESEDLEICGEESTNKEGEESTNKEGEEVIEEVIEDKRHLSKIKKLYREIVKLTHPDKVKNERLNEIYLKATRYYDEGNKIGIYAVCNEISIPYEIEDEDIELIYNEIQKYQQKISFIESTYTWKWFNCENDEQKDQILLNYIKLKIK